MNDFSSKIRPAPILEPGQSGTLPINALTRDPEQPRKHAESFETNLRELADNISRLGILQPILVRRRATAHDGDESDIRPYQIIAGERRWRAAALAGLTEVPVTCWEGKNKSAVDIAAAALAENIHREDLNEIEVAQALYRMQVEYDLTHEGLAAAVGLKRDKVTRYLRLLELGPVAKKGLVSKRLSFAHAEALVGVPEEGSNLIALAAISDRWTRDQVRTAAANWKAVSKAASQTMAEIVFAQTRTPDAVGDVGNEEAEAIATPSPLLKGLSTATLPEPAIRGLNMITTNRVAFEKQLKHAIDSAQKKGSKPQEAPAAARKKSEADPNIKSLEEDISQMLGTPVEIEPAIAQAGRKKGVPGKLIITFYDNDQLEGVLDGIRRGSRSR